MAVQRYYCKWHGCRQLLNEAGYCSKHMPLVIAREEKKQREREKAFLNARRTNYGFYRTKRWKELRIKILRRYVQCVCCGNTNDLHVDHVQPPRGNERLFFCENNLQVLCESCHRKRGKNDKDGIARWIKRYIRR